MSFLYVKIYKIMYYTFMRENVYIILYATRENPC